MVHRMKKKSYSSREDVDCREVRVTQFVEKMNFMSHCFVEADNSIGGAKSQEITKAGAGCAEVGKEA